MGALLILGLVVIASLALGSQDLDPVAVVQALVAPDGSMAQRIVTDLRMPRTVVALAVGMALGTAGLLMQGLTRNPIADPGILGVSAGAPRSPSCCRRPRHQRPGDLHLVRHRRRGARDGPGARPVARTAAAR